MPVFWKLFRLKLFAWFLLQIFCNDAASQTQAVAGRVFDSLSGEGLAHASVSAYVQGQPHATLTNRDGNFVLFLSQTPDSVRCTIVGYCSRTIKPKPSDVSSLRFSMLVHARLMEEVVVTPFTAEDIVRKAADALPSFLPAVPGQTTAFYREIIRDSQQFYSIAEAVFLAQLLPEQKKIRLQLEKGRTKEGVAFTRLFEDFHPGGGPQAVLSNSFSLSTPPFLQRDELKKFNFSKDDFTYLDGRGVFVIGFDQRPGVKESLEKGKLFIDATDYRILKYVAQTSERGLAYVQHLEGSDKIFAPLLGVTFRRNGHKKTVHYSYSAGKAYLSFVEQESLLEYKQPRKEIDLNLTVYKQIVLQPATASITQVIAEEQEWKRKQMVRGLPFLPDSIFWEGAPGIPLTASLQDFASAIGSGANGQQQFRLEGWKLQNQQAFSAYSQQGNLLVILSQRSSWDDEDAGPFLYQTFEGNRAIECHLKISKTSDSTQLPDKGFQQCGLMLKDDSRQQNYVAIGLGTGGNKNIKLTVLHTKDGKTKSTAIQTSKADVWLKLQRQGTTMIVYRKTESGQDWQELQRVPIPHWGAGMHAGLFGYARFAGNGPKMQPDIRAIFSQLNITAL